MSGPSYSEAELDTLATLYIEGASLDDMAAAVGRSRKSVSVRMVDLRRERRLSPRPRVHKSFAERANEIGLAPPISLDGDHDLVRRTRAEGGFPRAVITSAGTVWITGEGKPWRHYTVQQLGRKRRAG